MSTPTASVLRREYGPGVAWLAVIAVFVVGTAIGAVSASMIQPTQADPNAPAVVEQAPETELTRLLGNMDAAAERGDTRHFVQFRESLARLIRTSSISDYEALRGTGAAGE
jgi:hypothetical protein